MDDFEQIVNLIAFLVHRSGETEIVVSTKDMQEMMKVHIDDAFGIERDDETGDIHLIYIKDGKADLLASQENEPQHNQCH